MVVGGTHDAGDDLGHAVVVGRADDRALTDAVDRRHDALDLRRRHPLARHLEHAVRAPEKLEEPAGVLDHLIAGREPLPPDRPRRALAPLPLSAAVAAA